MTHEEYADKIAKLLAKAESTTPEEAELLVAKAQELMTKYAIDQAMVDAASGQERQKIVREEIAFVGSWSYEHYAIGRSTVVANDCRHLLSKGMRDAETGKPRTVLIVIGFESDVARVKMLNSSLQIQAQVAHDAWWKEIPRERKQQLGKKGRWVERRTFYAAFAAGVEDQLGKAQRRAAETAEAGYTGSVALVLRDKRQRVDDWIDREYGKLGKSYRRVRSGSSGAQSAGYRAGRSADAGAGDRVGAGSRGELGR